MIIERDGGELDRTRRLGATRFEQAVRRQILKQGRQKPCLRIVRKLFAALADQTGVLAHRPGTLSALSSCWPTGRAPRPSSSTGSGPLSTPRHEWSIQVLNELQLTELATSIPGVSAVGAAAILAETGDPHRFATARALVKHAGLAPREKLSGTFIGRTKLTGAGRPGLRLAAWRAVWGTQRGNTAYAARYKHLTSREKNKLTPTQAQTVIAAAILRHLHAVITTGQGLGSDDRHPRHPDRHRRTHRRLSLDPPNRTQLILSSDS